MSPTELHPMELHSKELLSDEMEAPKKKRYISPEKRQQTIDEV